MAKAKELSEPQPEAPEPGDVSADEIARLKDELIESQQRLIQQLQALLEKYTTPMNRDDVLQQAERQEAEIVARIKAARAAAADAE